MKGNTFAEFIDDILSIGGPEKEYIYKGKKYMLECEYNKDKKMVEMVIFQCFDNGEYIFRCFGKNFRECFEQYENAKIYDGKTIYEAEKDIEVIFG